jgi:2-polyprenyl-3-methyl-5-hydroxy-6-metoxy-1,4-benzoquinol methylase
MKNFKQWNEEMYSKYGNLNRIQGSNKYIKWFTNQRINEMSKMLYDAQKDDLLDLGCGAGFTARKILSDYIIFNNITLVDVSETAIKEASFLLKNYGKIQYICDNIEEYEPVRKYSIIVCSEVLEHTQSPEKVINTIIKAANKDTTIIITIPDENVTNLIKKIAFGFLGKPLDDWHIHKFNMKKIMQLTKNNFKLIEKKIIPNKLIPITYILKFKLI